MCPIISTTTLIFSIHALLAESDYSIIVNLGRTATFSIHALLAESDSPHSINCMTHTLFYPRSPCGERQLAARDDSIMFVFYPRSPCGERQFKMPVPAWIYSFLSTLSLRRATITEGSICFDSSFSIHALLAESDSKSAQNSGALLHI